MMPHPEYHQSELESISRTLQLSNDIYRNASDSDFAKSGGEIVYCFDSTVFSLFFETERWQSTISSIHRTYMAQGRRNRREWESIETQAAIIASEYLLSESLPGARNRSLYLSPWHRRELAAGLHAVIERLRDPERAEQTKKLIEKELELKLRFLRSVQDSRFDGLVTSKQVQRDLERLGEYKVTSNAINRYHSTRVAAEVLARCPITETFDQIHRLVSSPLQTRVKSLHTLIPSTESDNEVMRNDAQQWYLRLTLEISNQAKDGVESKRSDESKWNDARTLAFVRWASNLQKKSRRRVVLVTSDDLLFSTYRRWWVEQGVASADAEELFLLRRTFQYAPVFNLSDAQNDLSQSSALKQEVNHLFYRIREAVELQLLPFNLSSISTNNIRDLGGSVLKGREYLAMRTKDAKKSDPILSYFLSETGKDFIPNQEKAILGISKIWRDIERISIGIFYDKINKRLEDDRFIFGFRKDTNKSVESGQEILAFFRKSFDTLSSRSRQGWIPAAITFLIKAEAKSTNGLLNRLPKTLWFRLPDGRPIYELVLQWSDISEKQRIQDIATLQDRTGIIFVLASLFSFQQNDLLRAEDFANYALVVCDVNEQPEIYWEIKFLIILIKRFRIGSTAANHVPYATGKGFSVVPGISMSLYSDSLSLLDDCINNYEYNTIISPLNLLRFKSERAALRLFMAVSSIGFEGEKVTFDLSKLISSAEEDIRYCLNFDLRDIEPSLRPFFSEIESQFFHNAASLEVVRFLLGGSNSIREKAWHDRVAQYVYQQIESDEEEAPALVAERLAFLILVGDADPILWPQFENAIFEGMLSELPVDQHLSKLLDNARGSLFERLHEFDEVQPTSELGQIQLLRN